MTQKVIWHRNMAPSFLLLHVITNEKTLKLTQIDRLLAASNIFTAKKRSNISGRYTCCYIYLDRTLYQKCAWTCCQNTETIQYLFESYTVDLHVRYGTNYAILKTTVSLLIKQAVFIKWAVTVVMWYALEKQADY